LSRATRRQRRKAQDYGPHGQQYSVTPFGVGTGTTLQPSEIAGDAFVHLREYSSAEHESTQFTGAPSGVITAPFGPTVDPDGTSQI
jgi:hypothetical protein